MRERRARQGTEAWRLRLRGDLAQHDRASTTTRFFEADGRCTQFLAEKLL